MNLLRHPTADETPLSPQEIRIGIADGEIDGREFLHFAGYLWHQPTEPVAPELVELLD